MDSEMSDQLWMPSNIAELESQKGAKLGPTQWHVLSQSEIDLFADLTGDHQWIHVDEQRAAHGPFGGTIGHGLFTLSLGSKMMEELISFSGYAHSLNYGYDRVRFPRPRPVGSRVRMTASVGDVTRGDPKSALVSIRQEFEADDMQKPYCVADALVHLTEK